MPEHRKLLAQLALAISSVVLVAVGLNGTSAFGMDIEVDGSQVVMSGDVTGTECEELLSVLQQNPIRSVVLTQSKGGRADSGYCVGALIRQHQLSTVIRGSCASSCSRMWLGGVSRTLDGPNSRVGLHGNYDRAGNLEPGAPARLQAWIPTYAPVNRRLMEQWTTLPVNKQMMFFYNDRAELCDHGHCTRMPGWNALNAGLATQ